MAGRPARTIVLQLSRFNFYISWLAAGMIVMNFSGPHPHFEPTPNYPYMHSEWLLRKGGLLVSRCSSVLCLHHTGTAIGAAAVGGRGHTAAVSAAVVGWAAWGLRHEAVQNQTMTMYTTFCKLTLDPCPCA